MKKVDFEKVLEWLSSVLKCPVCSFKYNLERTKIIDTRRDDETGEAHLLVHSDCSQCKSSVMFSISITGPDIFTMSVVTDLTRNDTKKFQDAEPLTADDILGMHNFVKKFNGDFVAAFQGAGGR